jgi:hypothetical protein
VEVTPALVLAVWSAGLAAGGAVVAWWKVVGAGYVWLVSATVVLFGVFAALAGGGAVAWIGVGGAAAASLMPRLRNAVVGLFVFSTVLFVAASLGDSPLIPAVSGAVFMGGVTSEMILGHWYLVDPTLPRWALQRLMLIGGAGLIADVAYFGVEGVFAFGTETVLAWSYVALVAMTVLLVVGVWFSLKEPSYTGVMAATGLSYLGTLTAVGVLVVGRLVAWGA